MRRLGLLTLLAVAWLTAEARAEPVAVVAFEGKGAAAAQKRVVAELDKRGFDVVVVDSADDAPRARAIVTGKVDRFRKKWRLRVTIRSGADGETLATVQMLSRRRRRLPRQVRRLFWKRSRKALKMARAPEPEPAAEPAPKPARDDDGDDQAAPAPAAETDAEPASASKADASDVSARAAATDSDRAAIAIGIESRLYSRRLRYRDDLFDALYEHTADGTVEARLAADYFPLPWLGAAASYALTRPFDSEFEGVGYQTTGAAFAIGARLRRDAIGAELAVDYGGRSFALADAGEMEKPAIPNVAYRFVRAGFGLRTDLGAALSTGASAGYRHILSAGEIETAGYFPRSTAGGADANAWIAYAIADSWHLQLSATAERYFFTMNPEPGDPMVAGGAIDQYLGLGLALEYHRR